MEHERQTMLATSEKQAAAQAAVAKQRHVAATTKRAVHGRVNQDLQERVQTVVKEAEARAGAALFTCPW